MKRILVVSDLHCGHTVGLTPPKWQRKAYATTKHEKFSAIQAESWKWFKREVRAYGPYDIVVCNGDAIDGRGERSGGTELITPDRDEQCEIAVEALRVAMGECKTGLMTYGTPYHTGTEEDWEGKIAKALGCKIGGQEQLRASGVVFDFKHKIGASSVPHTRGTALGKAGIWSQLIADRGAAAEADVLVRSHVHYHSFVGGPLFKPGLMMTTPALQAMGTKYGSRQCEGIVDFGFVVFECERGAYTWFCRQKLLETNKISPMEV